MLESVLTSGSRPGPALLDPLCSALRSQLPSARSLLLAMEALLQALHTLYKSVTHAPTRGCMQRSFAPAHSSADFSLVLAAWLLLL